MIINEGSITVFLLATAGLTFFLQNSEILAWLRNWLIRLSPWFFKLFECSFCLGTYSSFLMWLVIFGHSIIFLPAFIFAGAFFTLAINNILTQEKK